MSGMGNGYILVPAFVDIYYSEKMQEDFGISYD
jgi:hypothetical protein